MSIVINLANKEQRKMLRETTSKESSVVGGGNDTQNPIDTRRLESVRQLGEFRGQISGVVGANFAKCIVLDITCSQVTVVATPEFSDSGVYTSIINQLKGERFYATIAHEYIADEDLISQVRMAADATSQLSAQRNGGISTVVNEETKYLTAYDDVIRYAWRNRASDVHFQINNYGESEIYLRIYGRMRPWKKFNTQLLAGSLTAAYSSRTKSGTNSGGAMSLERATSTITVNEVDGKTINGRFSGYPLVGGYDVVIRLLEANADARIPSMEELGYERNQIDNLIEPALLKNSGLFAIAGSTGSGKSTSLRTFMTTLPGGALLKKYAIEDPVEYNIPGVRQISIQRGVDDSDELVRMKFMAALRSMMRMDPDVLMIGEIRDHQSASIASELNRTGHRVLTTVHGDGCVDVLSRLCSEEIAIPPDLLASKRYLSAVMYQKLMPILCPECKLPAKDHYSNYKKSVLKDKFGLNPDTMFVINPKGCSACSNPQLSIYGTAGLTAVAEVLIPNESILQAVGQKDWVKAELAWRGQRTVSFDDPDMLGKTAFEHALYKLSQGMIDLSDIESEFQPIETYEVISPVNRVGDTDGV